MSSKTSSHTNSLFHPECAPNLLLRLRSVSPTSQRLWGRMTAHQMLCHLSDGFRGALGERPCEPVGTPFRQKLLRLVALHLPVQWPKGRIQTLREVDQELEGTPPTEFFQDRAELERLVQRFAIADGEIAGRSHPMFGPLTRKEWGRWGYLHVDHHFRQFGV